MWNRILNFFMDLLSYMSKLEHRPPSPQEVVTTPWMRIFEQDLLKDWKERSPGDNPNIQAAFEMCGYGRRSDETAWCGVYVGYTLYRAGFYPPSEPAWARHYSNPEWGTKLDGPQYGCIVNVERGTAGGSSHVGFCLSWDSKYVRIGGGNQSNNVTDNYKVPLSKVISYKLPPRGI